MTTLIVSDVRPWGGPPVDVVIDGATIVELRPRGDRPPPAAPPAGAEVVDGGGRLALPGCINAHAHVDKSWWGLPWVPSGGAPGIEGRIAHERAERGRLGIPSVGATERVLREFLRHGTTATRTHVDVDLDLGLRGIEVVREAAARLDGAVELEVVAFPQDGVVRRPGTLALLGSALEQGADVLGGLDPCAIDRDPVAQLDGLFALAEREGCGLDLHLHSRGELGAFELELVLDRTRRLGLAGRVTIAHGFALGDLPVPRQQALLEACAELGVSWTTVAPVTVTPLPWALMRAHGVALGLGTDGIRDLWAPYGDGDLLRIAQVQARLAQVREDHDLTAAVRLATSEGGRFVGREVHDLVVGARADLVLVTAENVPDGLVRAPRRDLVVAGGRVVVRDGEVVG